MRKGSTIYLADEPSTFDLNGALKLGEKVYKVITSGMDINGRVEFEPAKISNSQILTIRIIPAREGGNVKGQLTFLKIGKTNISKSIIDKIKLGGTLNYRFVESRDIALGQHRTIAKQHQK